MNNAVYFLDIAKATTDSATSNNFINWVNNNNGFVAAIFALFSIILSIIALIISLKSAKEQNKIQQAIAEKQNNLQKEHYLASIHPYKINCRKVLNDIKFMVNNIDSYLSNNELKDLSVNNVVDKYYDAIKSMNITLDEAKLTISESEYFLGINTSVKLSTILLDLEQLNSKIEFYKMFYKSTISYAQSGEFLSKSCVEEISEQVKKITNGIQEIMPEILYDSIII